jgi:hypothetical protein
MWDASMGRAACGTDFNRDGTCFKSTTEFTHYPIYVGGTQVNSRNSSNVLSQYITGGKVVYDPDTRTLHISVDCACDGSVVESYVYDLTVNVSGNSTLTAKDDNPVVSFCANTTITGPGKLTLKSESPGKNAIGIYTSKGDLTIKDADIEVVGDGFKKGITSENKESFLLIDNSNVSLSAHSLGCFSEMCGITLSNCYIEQPEASVIKADGIYGIDDRLIGGGPSVETLVIKAGEMTGIDELGVRNEELGVRNEELGVGNGQSIYDLSGRKVNGQLQKGNIYILNGKKVKR